MDSSEEHPVEAYGCEGEASTAAVEVNPVADLVDPLAELASLVKQAFELARKSKPTDWQRMTIAVLKNRLLKLTDRTFTETAYGVRNMPELVALLPDLLSVDDSQVPPVVELKRQAPAKEGPIPHRGHKLRPDLWTAVMDYASGREWVWSDGQAIAVAPGESQDPVLPTLSPEDMRTWRDAFADEFQPRTQVNDVDRLEEWRVGRGRTVDLPPALRVTWNERLKAGVTERLTGWFLARGEALPGDLFVPVGESRRAQVTSPEGASLRAFVAGCVSLMTSDELAALQLPAGVVHRYMGRYGDRR
jgi:hypothetical protein